MNKFKLHIGDNLQGKFEIRELNIAFVFQVNCPGCFIYGIPMMNRLYDAYFSEIGFLGISTAFEDFEYNTPENTALLLKEAKTVGETSKYMKETGQTTYNDVPRFPVVFDSMIKYQDLNIEDLLDTLERTHPTLKNWNDHQRLEIKKQLESHYKNLDSIAQTFTLNQMKGTPSFVIFDKDLNILDYSFGRPNEQRIHQILK